MFMKKLFISVVLLSSTFLLNSCKKDATSGESPTTETSQPSETASETEAKPETLNAAEPKSYVVAIAAGTPETILIGKSKEASVKIINLKAIDLTDPDGKSLGIQLSYDIELTNKNAIGKSSISLDPYYFRLELDNGQKITHESHTSVSAAPESTANSTGNIFKIPAGSKPKALNLFLDDTRVSVPLEMK